METLPKKSGRASAAIVQATGVAPPQVFALEKDTNESASDKLNDLIASKQTPKLESSINAQTGEVLSDLPY